MNAKSFSSRVTALLLVLGFFIVSLSSCAYFDRKSPFSASMDYSLPGSISLSQERMPVENPVVWEKLDREFTIAVWDRPQVILWLKRAGRYFPYIEKRLAEEGMPDDLKYLAVVESALLTGIQSSKGAAGLWQLMPRTGRHYGLRKDKMIDERLDFERSTEAALKYIKYLRETFGTWTLVLAAYNCGDSYLKREIRKQKVGDFYSLNLPSETKRFIFRIAAAKIIMENSERYGFYLKKDQIYQPLEYDRVEVRIRKPLHLTDLALDLGTDYRALKELNPQIRGTNLASGRYSIKVPPGSGAKVAAVLQDLIDTAPGSTKEVNGGHYVVRPGDTLSHIAVRTGVPLATLRRLNDIHGSLLRVGQMLQLTP
jgi:hypothetical protein